MHKDVLDSRPIWQNIVLQPAGSRIPVVRSRNADARTNDFNQVGEHIDVGPALKKSRISKLYGRPYPIQFRNQGAFGAWKQALGKLGEWTRWADPKATC